MGLATLIIVTVMSASAPAPMPQIQDMPDMAVCRRVMDAAMEGVKASFIGNATYAHQDVKSTQENGWTVLRTPMKRIIGQAKCESHGGASTNSTNAVNLSRPG